MTTYIQRTITILIIDTWTLHVDDAQLETHGRSSGEPNRRAPARAVVGVFSKMDASIFTRPPDEAVDTSNLDD